MLAHVSLPQKFPSGHGWTTCKRVRWTLAAGLFFVLAAWTGSARSQEAKPPPAEAKKARKPGDPLGRTREELGVSDRRKYSQYEIETMDLMLEEAGGTIDRNPEGKRIESVEVVTLDFIEKRDPVPVWFNVFHSTTRPHIIERELLLEKGDRWSWDLVDETERNLRALSQLSIVLILPLEGETEDSVRLLAVTKDIISFRLNSNITVIDGKLAFLFLQPSEENVFGRHKNVSTLFRYEPDTVAVGLGYTDRRLWGSRIGWNVNGNVIVNRGTGRTEGSFGSLRYAKPLYSTRSKWAWGTAVAWLDEVSRRFSGITQVGYRPSVDGPTPLPAPPRGERPAWVERASPSDLVPFEWRTNIVAWTTSVARSYGSKNKTNIEWGVEANRRSFTVDHLDDYDPVALEAFREDQVPRSTLRIGPFTELTAFSTDFLRTVDTERLGLQEDLRLGHVVSMKVYTSAKAAMGTRDLLGIYNGLSYTFPMGSSGLLRLYGSNRIELAGSIDESDAQAEAGLRLITPTLLFGRFIYDGGVLHRYRDFLNTRTSIGGDGRLRGYKASSPFRGKDVAASNLEFRTSGVQIFSFQAGLAAFWDAAHAADGFGNLDLRHGLGFGFRGFFPQLDRIVGRLDFAFPLSEFTPQESNGFSVVLSFGQAFGLPQVAPNVPVLSQ